MSGAGHDSVMLDATAEKPPPLYANKARIAMADDVVVLDFGFEMNDEVIRPVASVAIPDALFRKLEDMFLGVRARREAKMPPGRP